MTATQPPALSRRPFLVGGLALLGLGATGFFAFELPVLFNQKYAATPYDDLLSKLSDRERAARFGAAILTTMIAFRPETTAAGLRKKLRANSLSLILANELREADVTEIRGWIVPKSLASLCALAAKENRKIA